MSDSAQLYTKETAAKIAEIEKEIRETPYHKGTEHHIGKLKARLVNLKDKETEIQTKSSGGGGGGGYAVKKNGDATVVLVGPPSVGKSTLINKITNAESKVAAYAFTTVSVIPGMLKYKDAYIQIFDLPGIIEGAKEGKGRGKEVLSVSRGADLIIIMCDPKTSDRIESIKSELEGAGVRLNKVRPNVVIEKKVSGGIYVHSNIKQNMDDETIKGIASEMGVKNGEIFLKQKVSMDELIDSFSTSRVYIPATIIMNKADTLTNKDKRLPDTLYISADKGTGIETFKEKIWEKLKLIRVYLVHPDEDPSLNNPIIMREGNTLSDVAQKIGSEFASEKKMAKIWGSGAHFPSQEVSLSTKVQEGMQIRFI